MILLSPGLVYWWSFVNGSDLWKIGWPHWRSETQWGLKCADSICLGQGCGSVGWVSGHMWCWCGLNSWAWQRIFLPRSPASADSFAVFVQPCTWSVPSIGSHTFVWTRESTPGQPSKTECGRPSGREIENSRILNCLSENGCTTAIKKKEERGRRKRIFACSRENFWKAWVAGCTARAMMRICCLRRMPWCLTGPSWTTGALLTKLSTHVVGHRRMECHGRVWLFEKKFKAETVGRVYTLTECLWV